MATVNGTRELDDGDSYTPGLPEALAEPTAEPEPIGGDRPLGFPHLRSNLALLQAARLHQKEFLLVARQGQHLPPEAFHALPFCQVLKDVGIRPTFVSLAGDKQLSGRL